MYICCPTRAKICADPGKDCFYSRKKGHFHFDIYEFNSTSPSNTTVLVLLSWPVEIQSLEVLKKHIYYCVSLWRYNRFPYLHPFFCVSGWERQALCSTHLFFSHWGTTSCNGSQDNTVPEQLIFRKIQLERHIPLCILTHHDSNFLTYVSGRSYPLYLLSLCRATSWLLFFFLNSLAFWYQHLMTT